MSSSLSAIMMPPLGSGTDLYDGPTSPRKAKKKNEGRSTPGGGRVLTPARDSSIGRDIIRDVDIDRYQPVVDATVIAAETNVRETVILSKGGSIDPQSLQKQPSPEHFEPPFPEKQASPERETQSPEEQPSPEVESQSSKKSSEKQPTPEPAAEAEAAETLTLPETLPEPREADPADAAPLPIVSDLGEVEIVSFETHRVDEDNATVDIRVKWANGEETWEPEWSLQQQVPGLVYKYWDGLDGRETATGLEIYHVFRVLKRTLPPKGRGKKEYMYQVQWVGYRRGESTWEHESKLAQIAPEELIKYEAKNGTAPEAPAPKPKRGIARGPGRPRKKARVDYE